MTDNTKQKHITTCESDKTAFLMTAQGKRPLKTTFLGCKWMANKNMVWAQGILFHISSVDYLNINTKSDKQQWKLI